jgi:hypothetical protein
MGESDKREQDMLTPNAADLVPVEMPWTGTRKSPLILFETPYRQLIPYSMFDPDLSDANGLLMAKSGGGKTLAAQQMLLMAARANALISILERGDSYQPLVELMGGEMIQMSLDSDQTINPWDLPKSEDKPSNDQLSFLKNLTRHMLGENTPPDLDIDLLDSVLLEAIAATYKRCSAKSSNPIPLFGDLAAELAHWQDRDRNQKINAMAQMASTKLRAWVDEGPYAKLFDRPTTIQLDNPWLYFNVEKLKDDPRLERAMSLLIAHTATHRASGWTGQPSIVLLDECWALLESPILASVVVQLFRTARKRNASVWGISQTPEDFVGTPDKPNEHGAGIVKNATTKIIGKQPGDMRALREHVHLNDTALNQIKSFAHPKKGHSAEFLIAIGEKAESTHAIRVVPSPVDYWITTTYARERIYRKWWLATIRLLGIDDLLSSHEFVLSQDSAFELRETLIDDEPERQGGTMVYNDNDGRYSLYEEPLEQRRERIKRDKEFCESILAKTKIKPHLGLASVEETQRETLIKFLGEYGTEAVIVAMEPDTVLWTDDLTQGDLATSMFGVRRVWSQAFLEFCIRRGLLSAERYGEAVAKLVGMRYQVTPFNNVVLVQAAKLAKYQPSAWPFAQAVEAFSIPNAAVDQLFRIILLFFIQLSEEPVVSQGIGGLVATLLEALWQNPKSRLPLLAFRRNTGRVFGLNVVAEANFNAIFDQWNRQHRNDIL